MTLLFFIYSMSSGGAERVTANLANYWASKGWKITIVTLAPINCDFYEFHPKVARISLDLAGNSQNALIGLTKNFHRVLALRRILRTVKPDAVVGMMTGANVLLALAAWGLPLIRTIGSERIHPPQFRLGSLWEMLRRLSYGRLGTVVAQTRESADWIMKHTTAREVRVIPNPVVWPLATQEPMVEVASVISSSNRKLLLAVGRLSEQKQFSLLIESFQCLSKQHPEWDLVILGEGPLRSELNAQIVAADLERRVFLPGRAGNVGEWYQRADIYVLTSLFEGFPNTLIEAMSYGLPVVSFDCDTGPRDIIHHDVDGFLVAAGDKILLTSHLGRLMQDPSLRHRFSLQAIEIRDRFSMEGIAGMWESLFKEAFK
jgi:glycosyltransferase involved in cell wall biosynthesis